MIEQAVAVKEYLTHVTSCVHDRLSECPQYAEHLHEQANRIRAGSGAWTRPTAVNKRPPGARP